MQVNKMYLRGLTPRAELVTYPTNQVQQNNIHPDSLLLVYPTLYAMGICAQIRQHQYTPICGPPESRQGLRDYEGEQVDSGTPRRDQPLQFWYFCVRFPLGDLTVLLIGDQWPG